MTTAAGGVNFSPGLSVSCHALPLSLVRLLAAARRAAAAEDTAGSSDGGGILDNSGSTTGGVAEVVEAGGLDVAAVEEAAESAGYLALATLGAASCAMFIYVCCHSAKNSRWCFAHSHPDDEQDGMCAVPRDSVAACIAPDGSFDSDAGDFQ